MSLAQFSVQKVTPQSDGSSSKVKVKVRVNVHGIFSVSSASLVEVHKSEENEEPMETDQNAKEEEVIWTFCTIYQGLEVTCLKIVKLLRVGLHMSSFPNICETMFTQNLYGNGA
jgi:hypothetical protein